MDPALQSSSEFDEAYDDPVLLDFASSLFTEPLSKVPRRPAVVVPATASLRETIDAMNDQHTGCALVERDGKLAGIFTERDMLTRVAAKQLSFDVPISEVMTADPDTLPDRASVAFALRHMSVEGYRHIPLVSESREPVGVVAVRDIVAWMCTLFPGDVLNLPPTPDFPRTVDGG